MIEAFEEDRREAGDLAHTVRQSEVLRTVKMLNLKRHFENLNYFSPVFLSHRYLGSKVLHFFVLFVTSHVKIKSMEEAFYISKETLENSHFNSRET